MTRHAYEDQAMINYAPYEDRIEKENQTLRQLIDMGSNDEENQHTSKTDEPAENVTPRIS